jgi:hypothetical protein
MSDLPTHIPPFEVSHENKLAYFRVDAIAVGTE